MKGIKDLTKGSILQQLFMLAVPIMATSFIQMAYSLTDMAWVGRIGSEAVAAIGAVGILTWMSASVAQITKVGAEVGVGQAIGVKDEEKAAHFASHNITLSLILSLFWGGILFFFAESILSIYKLSEPITKQAVEYLEIISTALPFVFLSVTFTGIFNAAGRSKVPFVINAIGLGVNMILDPLFIMGFKMGTIGAAYATWIAQTVVILLFIYQLKARDSLLGNFPFFTSLKREYTWRIVRLGAPVAALNVLFALVNLIIGRTASTVGGHIGLMALTTVGQIEAITWNTSQGFSTALSTFVAQNYAAKQVVRVIGAFKATLVMTMVFGTLCSILFIFWGSEVFSIFVPEAEASRVGGSYLRIDGYSQLFMMLEITTQGLFYGVGRTLPPALISMLFNYARIPLALLLISHGLGLTGIWWAISGTSIVKGVACLIWFLVIKKQVIREMN
ncbi:MAG: MATE family efflux transporter [Phocaeicola sp.]